MHFTDRVLAMLGQSSTRADLFSAGSLEHLLRSLYDLSAASVTGPYNAVFDSLEFGVHFMPQARGNAKIYGQGMAQFEVHFEANMPLSAHSPSAEALWEGSIIAQGITDNAVIESVFGDWFDFSLVDERIVAQEGALPADQATLEMARTNALIALLQERSQTAAAVNTDTVERLKQFYSVGSVRELLTVKTGSTSALNIQFSEAPQAPPAPVHFPVRTMLLIGDDQFSLNDFLRKTELLRSQWQIQTSEYEPAAGLPALRDRGFIWLVPITVFDDQDWPGAAEDSSAEASRAARLTAVNDWLNSRGITLVGVAL